MKLRTISLMLCITTLLGGNVAFGDIHQISHVDFIIKENRTFDNYFGTFPGAGGSATGMTSSGQVITLGRTPDRVRDFCHSWSCTRAAVDGGAMDQFDLIPSANTYGDFLNYSEMTQADIPNYFSYAANFTLADNMFSSDEGPSFPNHLYTIAAYGGGAVENPLGLRRSGRNNHRSRGQPGSGIEAGAVL